MQIRIITVEAIKGSNLIIQTMNTNGNFKYADFDFVTISNITSDVTIRLVHNDSKLGYSIEY
jgi:hypothetical protein